METEKRFFNSEIEVRAADGKTTLRAYAVKYNELSRPIGWGFREQFAPGAFDEILKADSRQIEFDTICRYEHEITIGRRSSNTLRIGTDKTGLWYEIDVPGTTTGKDLVELVNRGDIRHSSFAFIVAPMGDEWSQNETDGEIRTVTKVAYLKDVAPVSDPAYPQTEGIESVKRSHDKWKESLNELEKYDKEKDWKAQYRVRQLDLINKQLNF